MKIVVIGGTGLIGSKVVEKLVHDRTPLLLTECEHAPQIDSKDIMGQFERGSR
jgi:nucleoside-diphosphate-sugar epimerase